MANINITSDTWTEISITSGTVQNISATADIELSAEQTDNSGVVLKPSELYQWDNETIYARAVTEDTGALRVVNFKKAAGGGGGYVLPVASASTLGGVKVGSGLVITDGVLSATGGGGGNPIGHIDWQMIVFPNYLKLDGDTLANASVDYAALLSFAQTNNLIASDTTNKALFQYDSETDVLTLPNYIDLVLQGGNSVEEKEAGLPNIKGQFAPSDNVSSQTESSGLGTGPFTVDNPTIAISGGGGYGVGYVSTTATRKDIGFDASQANSIYSDTVNTVQPPAISLIPQIKYQ